MNEIRIDFDSNQFDELMQALEDAKNFHEKSGSKARASVYANIQSLILLQRALQEYSLIQSKKILSQENE